MATGDLGRLIAQFFDAVGRDEVHIYNEFSLQHEFGIWLRTHADQPGLKIQFERPARVFWIEGKLAKKEIGLGAASPQTGRPPSPSAR